MADSQKSDPNDDPRRGALFLLADLSKDQFDLLTREIRGGKGFQRNRERCEVLANSLGAADSRHVFYLLSLLSLLYDRIQSLRTSGENVEVLVDDFLSSDEFPASLAENRADIRARIFELTKTNPEVDRVEKREWLESGILDHAIAFASFLDLRPNFSAERSELLELIPIVILEVMLRQEDGNTRPVSFQITKRGLGKLRMLVEDVEKKFRMIETHSTISPLLAKDLDQEANGEPPE